MAGFTQTALLTKLEELNASQQSIQTLSLWLIHHRKHHSTIVKTWIGEVEKADDHRKLTLMYLANDVIQNSKKKGPEYGKEFGHVLRQAFISVGDVHCSDKTRNSLSRILKIWEERGVYDKQQIASFRQAFNAALEPQSKRRKTSESANSAEYDIDDGLTPDRVTKLVSPKPVPEPRECPETQELIKVLTDLETSASSDAHIREKIAKLPPEVSEISLLAKVQDRVAAENLSAQVSEAVNLLTNYNTRLVTEMEDRKRAAAMLKDYIAAQRELLEQAEQRLEECQSNLEQVCKVREELQALSHLPMPEKPLPAATDLFKIRNAAANLANHNNNSSSNNNGQQHQNHHKSSSSPSSSNKHKHKSSSSHHHSSSKRLA
uniref:Regulation of nuclear pre-mRNA domain-containing protein 1A n=2 Tax=Cacopsylla melanoneura TaxID=428564 RepID=A0A8D8YIJ6_9HEMI